MDLTRKSTAIIELVTAVRSRHGDRRVRVVDYWPENPDTIGFERVAGEDAMVAVTTGDKEPGRYDISVDIPDREAADDLYLGSGTYQNCLIDGVLATIRKYVVKGA